MKVWKRLKFGNQKCLEYYVRVYIYSAGNFESRCLSLLYFLEIIRHIRGKFARMFTVYFKTRTMGIDNNLHKTLRRMLLVLKTPRLHGCSIACKVNEQQPLKSSLTSIKVLFCSVAVLDPRVDHTWIDSSTGSPVHILM